MAISTPTAMAAAAIDEAVRNVVAVGADPSRIAMLDNFCWGNTDRPEVLGSLVLRRRGLPRRGPGLLACRSSAARTASTTSTRRAAGTFVIPPTLLISALGRVPDVRQCVTMDLKEPGNILYLIGTTRNEMGGSHFHLVRGLTGGAVPRIDLANGRVIFEDLFHAIEGGLVRSCHDLSEGGLAVALAEMVFAGEVGADVTSLRGAGAEANDAVLLFSESPTRFLVEVQSNKAAEFEACCPGSRRLGLTVKESRLRVAGGGGEWIIWAAVKDMKAAWQKPLAW